MRQSFIMPTGSVVNSMTSINPVQVFVDDVISLFISGTVTVNIGGVGLTYDALDFDSAKRMIQAINNAINNNAIGSVPVIPDTPSALVWTSVTGNAYNVGDVPDLIITGSGFTASGIPSAANAMKISDGTQDIDCGTSINSDTLITLSLHEPFSDAAVYTIYYSLDNGITWTSTALTVTVT